jgi:hypothetical protein
VKALTTPQIVTVVPAFTVIELGATIWPEAFKVAFRHTFVPIKAELAPEMVVPAAMGKVCPPTVIEVADKAVSVPQTVTVVPTPTESEPEVMAPARLSVAVRQTLVPSRAALAPLMVAPGAIGNTVVPTVIDVALMALSVPQTVIEAWAWAVAGAQTRALRQSVRQQVSKTIFLLIRSIEVPPSFRLLQGIDNQPWR